MGAFRLLAALRGNRLPSTSTGAASLNSILANSIRGAADVDAMATLDGDKVHVLVWNYHDDLVAATAATVQIRVKVPAAFSPTVTVADLRVDEQNGDAYTVWKSQGSPPAPTAVQIQAMQAAMSPASLPAQAAAVANGVATVSLSLPRFGMSLLTLSPTGATPDAGTSATGGAAGSGSGGAGGGAGRGSEGSGGGGDGATAGGGRAADRPAAPAAPAGVPPGWGLAAREATGAFPGPPVRTTRAGAHVPSRTPAPDRR